jgi:tetratricopeptide (TPR) repeat protein
MNKSRSTEERIIGILKQYILACGRAFPLILMAICCSMPALAQDDQWQSALSLSQQGKNAEAETAWKALSEHNPSDPRPYAYLGLLEARQEHYPQAITYYRKAMELNPALAGLRMNLGLALFKDGDYRQAIQIFGPLLKNEPASSPETQRLTLLIGMSHYGLSEFAAATPFLKQAADQDPTNLTLLLTLAHSCLLSTQYQCVLDTYHRMIALNAESAEADMLMGEALDEMKETGEATRKFQDAVKANPKEPNVHFGLGYLLWMQGKMQEAAQEFHAELENDPGHLQAMLYLADTDIQMNRMDDARSLLEKLVKINPENSMEHLDLGVVYAGEGRNAAALAEFQAAEKLAPEDVKAHWRLARLYRSMGKTAESEAEISKARSINQAADDRLLKVLSRNPHGESAPPAEVAAPASK